ncbi:hypothetical protein EPN29_14210 [bacterium]|nr:MAG: hypothetical protein EPN29_14210 [bacterium]
MKSSEVQRVAFRKGSTICNVCRQKHNLTYDHIPPQCCGNDRAIVARRIYAAELVARQVDSRSHNGLKYRTLCKSCNGRLIGRWDDALGEFTRQVESIVSPALALPDRVSFNVRPGAIVRPLLGHVVAAKTQDDAIATDEKIRDYLVRNRALDSAVKVYCWLYPYRPIVVSRDFTFLEVEGESGKSPGIVSVIKFFPLAFCVLDGAGEVNAERITTLREFTTMDVDARADIALWRTPVIQPGWPERAMGNHLVLGGRTYVDSVTTVAPCGAVVTPGKQIQAEAWDGGDKAGVFNGLHAFVEIPKA